MTSRAIASSWHVLAVFLCLLIFYPTVCLLDVTIDHQVPHTRASQSPTRCTPASKAKPRHSPKRELEDESGGSPPPDTPMSDLLQKFQKHTYPWHERVMQVGSSHMHVASASNTTSLHAQCIFQLDSSRINGHMCNIVHSDKALHHVCICFSSLLRAYKMHRGPVQKEPDTKM
jgi:hypothetical protein